MMTEDVVPRAPLADPAEATGAAVSACADGGYPVADFLACSAVAFCLFMSMHLLVTSNLERLSSSYNAWFGTDVPRYLQWSTEVACIDRAHLHPLALLLYKCALGLNALGLKASMLTWLSLLPASAAAVATAAAACSPPWGGDRRLRALWLVVAVCVGSAPLFAALPETHALGGSVLMLQTLAVMSALRSAASGDRERFRSRCSLALGLGCIATGITLSNALPATILLASLLPGADPSARRHLAVRAVWTASALAFLGADVVALQRFTGDQEDEEGAVPGIAARFSREGAYTTPPSPGSILTSFRAMVVHQFGVPPTEVVRHTESNGQKYPLIYVKDGGPLPQAIPCALWYLGIFLWLPRGYQAHPVERKVIIACLAATAALVAFHAAYCTFEAFMFSPHAWPFVVLPGLCILKARAPGRAGAPAFLLLGAALMSLAMSAFHLNSLNNNISIINRMLR